MKKITKVNWMLLAVAVMISILAAVNFAGCGTAMETLQEVVESEEEMMEEALPEEKAEDNILDPDGFYTTKEDVARYLHLYGELPPNFITKSEAAALGWEASKGNLWEVTEHKSIGGDRFGNREGLLPSEEGRQYYECDIHYEGGYRGAERIVYSSDGLVYYTPDHYASFELLYGEE